MKQTTIDGLLPSFFDLGDELLDYSRFGEGAQVAQLVLLLVDNLSQYSPHNLTAASLGEVTDDVNLLGSSKGADDFADLKDEFLGELRLVRVEFAGAKKGSASVHGEADRGDVRFEGDKGVNGLACQFIGGSDH